MLKTETFERSDYSNKAKTLPVGFDCKLCGTREHCKWIDPEVNRRLIMNHTCYNCDLWVRTASQDMINPIWYSKIVMNGMRYTVKPMRNCTEADTPIVLIENLVTKERLPFCNLKITAAIPKHILPMFPETARIITDDPAYPIVDGNY